MTNFLKNTSTDQTNKNFLDWKTLRRANRHLDTPFQIKLDESDEPLVCEEVVRIVPGKRLVVFATWKNQLVVAKLFYDPAKAAKHCEREMKGIEALVASNIPTPALLFQGTLEKNRIYVLIFEKIMNANNLDDVWQQKQLRPQLEPFMHALVYELATQHVHGIVQHDFHLKNFLICNLTPPPFDEINVMDWLNENQLYILDGANIDKHEGVLPKEKSLEHLALFFAQLDVNTESLQKKLFQLYAHARGWTLSKSDIELFRKAKRHWIDKRWKRYEKKILRECTAFKQIKSFISSIMIDRNYYSPEFIKYLSDPESLFQQKDTQILKKGNSSTVAKVKIGNQFFVLKRYNIKDTWHYIRRAFRMTRAENAWKLGLLLQLFGIPTPKPIAFMDTGFFGFKGVSYLLMEYIDAPHIGNYLADCSTEQLTSTVAQVMVLLTNLAKLRLTHGDLKMTNILISKEGPLLIDLDGMVLHQSIHSLERSFKKEFQRLLENWEHQPFVKAAFDQL